MKLRSFQPHTLALRTLLISLLFLAATTLPACSSRQRAAIHPGACFGLDLTRESNSILARLISPISASDLRMTLSREVRYPLGSTEVDVPFVVVVPEIWGEVRRSARRMRREIPGLVSERGSYHELDRIHKVGEKSRVFQRSALRICCYIIYTSIRKITTCCCFGSNAFSNSVSL